MPKIICNTNVDDHLEGAVLDSTAFDAAALARLKRLGAIRELTEEELPDFLDEEEGEVAQEIDEVPARPKTLRSMNLTEIAAFCVEHGLDAPTGTRAKQIEQVEAALSARNTESMGLPPDKLEESTLPDDITS